jgi:sulfonate transport system permease protein
MKAHAGTATRRASPARLALSWPGRARMTPVFLALLTPALILAIWQIATQQGWVTPLMLPPPGAVLTSLHDLVASGDLASNLAVSLRRVVLGFCFGAAAGLAVGGVMGLSRIGEAVLRPLLLAFVQIPVLAWIPLLMIPFGIGETLKLSAIGISAFAPVFVNTAKGFRQVPPALIEVGTLYKFNWSQRVRHILLPGALPGLFTGLRLGLTQSWQALIVVELVASTDGIGYLTVIARQMFQFDQMLAAMLVIGVVGFCLDRSLRSAEARLVRRFGGAAA